MDANNQIVTTKSLFQKNSIQKRFEKLMGDKAAGFISSVLSIVNNNKLLATADPNTVLAAASMAATLDLPINQSLGFAWIVPYKGQAQFQIGWKGFVQLALRTGMYKTINVLEVYDNQFKSFDRLLEVLDADFTIAGEGEIVGYAAWFELNHGFKKLVYWSKAEVIAHAKKYSQAYGSKFSPWSDPYQFHAMAKKTVLKNMLAKWGIMSIDMQNAQMSDQSTSTKEGEFEYPDNIINIQAIEDTEEQKRALGFIAKATTIEDLEMIEESYPDMPEEISEAIKTKKEKINAKGN